MPSKLGPTRNFLVLCAVLLSACAGQPVAVKVGEPQAWGSAPRVVPVSRLFIAGQPDDAALDEAQRQGVAAIINLRGPTEMDWDEASAAVARNMAYHQVPLSGADPEFDPAVIARISSLVERYSDRRVLVHCASGNRAAAWLAIHLVQDHAMTTNAALEVARPAGLTYAPLEGKVRRFLGDEVATP
jgi:protein tyrosine phosphatase (PTP) superfamily phosphohydrolase (DUF442 family)